MDYVSNAKDTIQKSVPAANEITDNITNVVSNAKNTVSSTMNEFSSKSAIDASSEFLDANGLVAKFAFLILIIAFFLFLLNLGISIVSYFINPSKSPYVFPPGMVDGNAELTIAQDPADTQSAIIYRSSNRSSGIEFTWSCWLNFNSLPKTEQNKDYAHIFNKGTGEYGTRNNYQGIDKVNDGPGLYARSRSVLDTSSNGLELLFVMNTISPDGGKQISDVALVVPNFPLNKWCHVVFRLKNKVLDCYVNGVIQGRTDFGNRIPKQNYDSVHVAKNGGFPGKISNLRYYDYALSVFEINSIVYYGPNTKASSAATSTVKDYGYLSNSWYTNVFA